MDDLRIGVLPISNKIVIGSTRRGLWGKNRTDVTVDAICAVAEHAKEFGKDIIVSDDDGKKIFTLKVEFEKEEG